MRREATKRSWMLLVTIVAVVPLVASCDPEPRRTFFGMSGTRDNPIVLIDTCPGERVNSVRVVHYPGADDSFTTVWSVSSVEGQGNIRLSASDAQGGKVLVPLAGPLPQGRTVLAVDTSDRGDAEEFRVDKLSPDTVLTRPWSEQDKPLSIARFHERNAKDCKP